jgi:hypothetical protein
VDESVRRFQHKDGAGKKTSSNHLSPKTKNENKAQTIPKSAATLVQPTKTAQQHQTG